MMVLDKITNQMENVLGTYSRGTDTLLGGTLFVTFMVVFILISIVLIVGLYVYCALALQRLAKRMGSDHSWYAWVPFMNVYLRYELAGINPLLFLLYIAPLSLTIFTAIPFVGFLIQYINIGVAIAIVVVDTISYMNICEKRGHDKTLGLIAIINMAQYVLLGVLAWEKDFTKKEK